MRNTAYIVSGADVASRTQAVLGTSTEALLNHKPQGQAEARNHIFNQVLAFIISIILRNTFIPVACFSKIWLSYSDRHFSAILPQENKILLEHNKEMQPHHLSIQDKD